MNELARNPDFDAALRALELNPIAEGDSILLPARGRSWSLMYFDPDGQPFDGDENAQTNRWMALKKDITNPEVYLKAALAWEQNYAIVCTSYMGINHNYLGGPPLVWETMISANGDWTEYQWRYCTRNAAKIAHQTIIDALVAAGMRSVGWHEVENR